MVTLPTSWLIQKAREVGTACGVQSVVRLLPQKGGNVYENPSPRELEGSTWNTTLRH